MTETRSCDVCVQRHIDTRYRVKYEVLDVLHDEWIPVCGMHVSRLMRNLLDATHPRTCATVRKVGT